MENETAYAATGQKRFALVAEEGPRYMGATTNVKPLEKTNQAVVEEALKRVDPTSKHGINLTIVESCLRACLPPHLRHSDPEYCRVYRRRKGSKISEITKKDARKAFSLFKYENPTLG